MGAFPRTLVLYRENRIINVGWGYAQKDSPALWHKYLEGAGEDPLVALKNRELDIKEQDAMRKAKYDEGRNVLDTAKLSQKAQIDQAKLDQNLNIAEMRIENQQDLAKMRKN